MSDFSTSAETRQPSVTWVRKMTKLFGCLDIDKNGQLNRQDCEYLAKRFQVNGQLTDEAFDRFSKILFDWWDYTMRDKESVDLNNFITTRYSLMKSTGSAEEAKGHYQLSLEKMFQAIDTDGDGSISVPEWKVYFKSLGLDDETMAEESFRKVDINNDHLMSLDEFITGAFDFMYNEEESVYMEFLGPLPTVN